MGHGSGPGESVSVFVCAILGREEEILLVQRPSGDWALPTTALQGDERVVDAVDRAVRTFVEAGIDSAVFQCVIEDPEGLVLVFDVIPVTPHLPDLACPEGPDRAMWINVSELALVRLWPWALRAAMNAENPAWHGLDEGECS